MRQSATFFAQAKFQLAMRFGMPCDRNQTAFMPTEIRHAHRRVPDGRRKSCRNRHCAGALRSIGNDERRIPYHHTDERPCPRLGIRSAKFLRRVPRHSRRRLGCKAVELVADRGDRYPPMSAFFAVCACYAALAEGNALNATRPITSNTDENSKSLVYCFCVTLSRPGN